MNSVLEYNKVVGGAVQFQRPFKQVSQDVVRELEPPRKWRHWLHRQVYTQERSLSEQRPEGIDPGARRTFTEFSCARHHQVTACPQRLLLPLRHDHTTQPRCEVVFFCQRSVVDNHLQLRPHAAHNTLAPAAQARTCSSITHVAQPSCSVRGAVVKMECGASKTFRLAPLELSVHRAGQHAVTFGQCVRHDCQWGYRSSALLCSVGSRAT